MNYKLVICQFYSITIKVAWNFHRCLNTLLVMLCHWRFRDFCILIWQQENRSQEIFAKIPKMEMSSIVKLLEWWMRVRLKTISGRSWSTKRNEHRPYLIVFGIARAKKKVTQFRLNTLYFRSLISTTFYLKKIMFENCCHNHFRDRISPLNLLSIFPSIDLPHPISLLLT